MTTTEKSSENGRGTATAKTSNKEIKTAGDQDTQDTFTAETSLPEPAIEETPRRLEETRAEDNASHKESRSAKKASTPTWRKIEELDTEAKRSQARREYESQSIGKADAISEQRLVEEEHDAYYGDDEYENRLDKEKFD